MGNCVGEQKGGTLSVVPAPTVTVTVRPRQPTDKSLLISAAMNGELDMVKRILSRSVEKAWIDEAFLWAVDKGQLRMSAYLGFKGADINVDDSRALMFAAHKGDLPMVMLLVSLGANIHARKGEAVIHSIEGHHIGVTRYLFSLGICVSRFSLLIALQEPPCRRRCEAWKLGCDLTMRNKTYDLGDSNVMKMVSKYL